MKNEIYQMISKNIQPPKEIIQGKGDHEERTITTGFFDRATPQLRIQKKLVVVGRIFDGRIFHDDMEVIILKGILERVGVGRKMRSVMTRQ